MTRNVLLQLENTFSKAIQKYKSEKFGVFKVNINETGTTLIVILVLCLVVHLLVPNVH